MSDGNIWIILYGTIIPTLLCSVVFVTRVCSRALIAKTWAWDDSLAYLSWVSLVIATVLTCMSSSYGLGKDMQDVPAITRTALTRLELASQVAYQACLLLTKLSVIYFYRRILVTKAERTAVLSTAIVAVIAAPTFIVLYFLQCSPQTESSPFKSTIFCFNSVVVQTISATYQVLLSLAISVLVIPTLLRIVWSTMQKMLIFALAVIGGFGVATSISRIYIFTHYVYQVDASWNSAQFAMWSIMECSVAIFCANLVSCSRKWEKTITDAASDLGGVVEVPVSYHDSAWVMDLSDEKHGEQAEWKELGFKKVCWGRPRSEVV